MKLKILDLFSGLGGFSLGLERTGHFKTVAFCDNDKYCNLVLQKHWKGVKIYNNVKEITKEKLIADGVQLPDIITGGFPCQPFSVAGKQAGTDDDRHLWPVMFRIIQELTPRWVIGENVKGLTTIQDGVVFETVCTDLEGEGYEVRTFNIPAAGVGAPHRRERLWIVAHRKESMVNTDDVRLEQHNETKEEPSWWRTSTTLNQQVMWLTPSATIRGERSPEAMKKREEYRKSIGRTTVPPGSLAEQVLYGKPTTDMKIWRTPDAHCNRGPSSEKRMKMKLEKGMPISINDQVAHPNLMWPTPTSTERSGINPKTGKGAGLSKAVKMWPTPTQDSATERTKKYSQGGKPLTLAVKEAQMWPTPRAAIGMTMKLSQGMANLRHKKYLETEVAYQEKAPGGTLNPTWVEWLMGDPAGYTDLKDWEILSSRKLRKKSVEQSSKPKKKKKTKTT